MSFRSVTENDNFIVEYDDERNIYRVSYFVENHFQDEIVFDGKEINDGKIYPVNHGQ